jgi:hypothetical protein
MDRTKLLAFIREAGRTAKGPGRIYLVGGATALLLEIREQTIDIDLKLDPEPKAIFEAIAILKERLSINVELASPDQFLPPLPGWRDRSEFITRSGPVDFFHYDFYSQVLSKLLRGHEKDLVDAHALVALGKVALPKLDSLFRQIQSDLIRYPSIDAASYQVRVAEFIAEQSKEER